MGWPPRRPSERLKPRNSAVSVLLFPGEHSAMLRRCRACRHFCMTMFFLLVPLVTTRKVPASTTSTFVSLPCRLLKNKTGFHSFVPPLSSIRHLARRDARCLRPSFSVSSVHLAHSSPHGQLFRSGDTLGAAARRGDTCGSPPKYTSFFRRHFSHPACGPKPCAFALALPPLCMSPPRFSRQRDLQQLRRPSRRHLFSSRCTPETGGRSELKHLASSRLVAWSGPVPEATQAPEDDILELAEYGAKQSASQAKRELSRRHQEIGIAIKAGNVAEAFRQLQKHLTSIVSVQHREQTGHIPPANNTWSDNGAHARASQHLPWLLSHQGPCPQLPHSPSYAASSAASSLDRKNAVMAPFIESASGVINLAAASGDFPVACRVLLLLERFNLLSPLPSSVGSAFVAAAAAAGEAEAASKMLQIMHTQGVEMRRKAFGAIVRLLLSRGQGFLVLKRSGLLRLMKEQRCLPLPAHLLALLLQDANVASRQLASERYTSAHLVSFLEAEKTRSWQRQYKDEAGEGREFLSSEGAPDAQQELEEQNGESRQRERVHCIDGTVQCSRHQSRGNSGAPPPMAAALHAPGGGGTQQHGVANSFATELKEAEQRCREEVRMSVVRLRQFLDASREVLDLLHHVTEHEEPLASGPAINFCNALRDLDLPVAHVGHVVLRHEEDDENQRVTSPSAMFVVESGNRVPPVHSPPSASPLQTMGAAAPASCEMSVNPFNQTGTWPVASLMDRSFRETTGEWSGESSHGQRVKAFTATTTSADDSGFFLEERPPHTGPSPSLRPVDVFWSAQSEEGFPGSACEDENSHLTREKGRERKGSGQQPRRYGVCTGCGVHLRRIPLGANERRLLRVGVLKLSAMLQPRQLRALLAFEVNLSRVQGLRPARVSQQRSRERRREPVEEWLHRGSRVATEAAAAGTLQAGQRDASEADSEREVPTTDGPDPPERPRERQVSARENPVRTDVGPPSLLRPGKPRFTIVLDAANIAYNRQNREDGIFSYAQIECVRRELISRGERPLIILPAAYFWGVRHVAAPESSYEFKGQRRSTLSPKAFNSHARESWFQRHVFEMQSAPETPGGASGEDPATCRRGLCRFCRDEIVVPNRCKPSKRRRRDWLGKVATNQAARALRAQSTLTGGGDPLLFGVGPEHGSGSSDLEALDTPEHLRERSWRSHLTPFPFPDEFTGLASSGGTCSADGYKRTGDFPRILTNRQRVTCQDRALLNQWERDGCLFVCGLGAHDDHYHLLASLNSPPATEGLWRRWSRVSPLAQPRWNKEEKHQRKGTRSAVEVESKRNLADLDSGDKHVGETEICGWQCPSVGEGSGTRSPNPLSEDSGSAAIDGQPGEAADFQLGSLPAVPEAEKTSPWVSVPSNSAQVQSVEESVLKKQTFEPKSEEDNGRRKGREEERDGKQPGPAERRTFLGYVWDADDNEGDADIQHSENDPLFDAPRGFFPLSLLTNDRFRDHRLSSQQRIPFRHWRQLALLPYAFQWGLSPHGRELRLSPASSPFSPPFAVNDPSSQGHNRRKRERTARDSRERSDLPGRSSGKRRRGGFPQERTDAGSEGVHNFLDPAQVKRRENLVSDASLTAGRLDYGESDPFPSSLGAPLDTFPPGTVPAVANGSEQAETPGQVPRVEGEKEHMDSFTCDGDVSSTTVFLSTPRSPTAKSAAPAAAAVSQNLLHDYGLPSRNVGRRAVSPSSLLVVDPHASSVESSKSEGVPRRLEAAPFFADQGFRDNAGTLPQSPWMYEEKGHLRSYPDEERTASFQQISQSFPLLFVGMTKHVTQRMQVFPQVARPPLPSPQRGETSGLASRNSGGNDRQDGDSSSSFSRITELLQEHRRQTTAGISIQSLGSSKDGLVSGKRPSTDHTHTGTGLREREESLVWHVPLREEDEGEGIPDFAEGSVSFRSRKRDEEGIATSPDPVGEGPSVHRRKSDTETERGAFPSFQGTSRLGGAAGGQKGEANFPDTVHAVEWRHQEALERSRTWLGIDLTQVHQLLREREEFLANN
ncbi:hypothetical protein TGVAND_304910 [Toxoplasma gondii VAND]|uniref:Uncharacterized protein n=1 Tax=Toxoplasma gondii VAND TaxID=933077 RepID=A0A086PQB1_TOXGO|nr:hypothetical protein TGVAND_304910 [Toxoplasma gondii VAND]